MRQIQWCMLHDHAMRVEKVIPGNPGGWSSICPDWTRFTRLPGTNHLIPRWNMGFSTMQNTMPSIGCVEKIGIMVKSPVEYGRMQPPNPNPEIPCLCLDQCTHACKQLVAMNELLLMLHDDRERIVAIKWLGNAGCPTL